MNKLLKKLLILGLASTVALASVGGVGCKDEGPVNNGPTVPNTSVVEKPDPEITMAASLSLVLGEEKNAGVVTKNVNGDIVYSVNNEGKNVVTFEGGIVKAIGAGSAVITATFGTASASCPVTVTYGNYLPTLEIASNLTEGVYVALGSNNSIAPYICYNGISFDDGEFTYSSDNEECVSVSKDGVITANKATDTPVNVTVNADWRDFSSNELVTLTKTFSVKVRNNVSFFVNGQIPVDLSINTPATFQSPAEHNNVMDIRPTVIVNGEEKVLSGSNVTVTGINGTQKGRDFLWDASRSNFAAFRFGTALVELSYNLDGDVFSSNFEIQINRPLKVLTNTVELFSARSGLFKVDNGNGTFTNKALETVAWGKDVTLIDAYSDGVALTVNNSNGAIYGLTVNQDCETNATITLGTATDLVEVPVSAAAYYMSTAEEVKDAVEQIGLYQLTTGYHKLLCDIDMEGVLIDNRIDSDDDFGAVRYAGYREDGAYIDSTLKKKIGFNGVFDGDGHTISNARVTVANHRGAIYDKYPYGEGTGAVKLRNGNNRCYGFFHNVLADGVIKNVAFYNFAGQYVEGNQNTLYGLVAPLAYGFSGTLENVYVNVNETNATSRGIVQSIGSSAKFNNVLVEFERPEDYDFATQVDTFCSNDLYAYGYGSFSGGYPSASAKYNGVYLITRMPVAFDTTRGFSSGDTTAKNAVTYGENETELMYNFSAFDIVHGAVKHTVQSTAGDHSEDGEGNVRVTGKTRIAKGIQRYNNYYELANCEYEKTAERSALFAASPYWTMAGNVPIWYTMLDKHNDNYSAYIGGDDELTIDLYDEQPIDVTLYGAPADRVVFTENSDLIEITANNVIKGLKIGTGAEVTAVFTYGGQERTLTFTVDVLYPFYLEKDGVVIDGHVEQPEGEQFNIQVMASGNVVENVKFTTSSSSLTVTGNTFKGVKYEDGVVVTAEFTYMGDNYVETFTVDVLDMLAENAKLMINGSVVEGEEISLVIDADPANVAINSNGTEISAIVASSNDRFVVVDNKLQANLYGQAELAFTFVSGGEVHVKKVIANAVHPEVATKINSIVDFDAHNGKFVSSEIDNSGVVSVTATFGKEMAMLTKENGGITEDGAIRAKQTNGDLLPGIPLINNSITKFEDAKLEVTLATYKKVYTLTAQYYTSIIETPAELKAALDIDYTVMLNNSGFYKLANNISIDADNPLKFDYVGAKENIKNINSSAGFTGLFDGCGYTIDMNGTDFGAWGLFASFNHSGGYYLKDYTTVKNLAIIEYKNVYYSTGSRYAPVLATYVKDHDSSGNVMFNNIYVSYHASATPNGIVYETGRGVEYNNVVVDASAVTAKPTYVDATYGAEAQGLIDPTQGFKGGALFGTLRRAGKKLADNTNAVLIGQLPIVKYSNLALAGTMFTHEDNGNGTYNHILRATGFTYNQATNPLLTNSNALETYYGIPANKQDIAVITGLREATSKVLNKSNGSAAKAAYYCPNCFGTFNTRSGNCTVEGCGTKLVKVTDLWKSPVAYTWTFDIQSYENPASTEGNGVIVFNGVTKYDTVQEMADANNDFASFIGEAGNGLWKVENGTLSWLGAQA